MYPLEFIIIVSSSVICNCNLQDYFEPEFLKNKKQFSPKIHSKMTNVYQTTPSPRLQLKKEEESHSAEISEDIQGYLVPYFEESSTANDY